MSSINLEKEKIINLSKVAKTIIQKKGIDGKTAQVKVAYDISGSMDQLYRNGTMQKTSDKLLALAMNFDTDQSIDLFAFNTQGYGVGTVTLDNFHGFVEQHVKNMVGGGTNYAPIMKVMLKELGIHLLDDDNPKPESKKGLFGGLFNKKVEPAATPTDHVEPVQKTPIEPVYIIFITDGDNGDKEETKKVIKQAAEYGVFWKFVGIGNERFTFLESLDNMAGRFIDNAHFIKIKDIDTIEDAALYDELLIEFPEWLHEAKTKQLIM